MSATELMSECKSSMASGLTLFSRGCVKEEEDDAVAEDALEVEAETLEDEEEAEEGEEADAVSLSLLLLLLLLG